MVCLSLSPQTCEGKNGISVCYVCPLYSNQRPRACFPFSQHVRISSSWFSCTYIYIKKNILVGMMIKMRKRNTLFMKIEPPKIIIPVLIKIEIKTDDIANSYYLYPICCREHINRGNQNPGSRTTTMQSEHTVLDTTPATQPYIVNRPRTSSSQRYL